MVAFKEKMRLNRPFNQNLVVGAMLFCLPGMYSAITGLGAGGGKPSSLEVANNVNAIIYIFLAFGSIVVGFILHKLTPRICLIIGALGYPLYIGGLWYYDRSGNSWLVYLSGVLSGISGAALWTTAAYIEFCYPEEKNKAMYISIQWALRSVGATVGASIAFGANYNATTAVGVSTGVYIAFILIQCAAIFIAAFLVVHPSKVIRDDGSHIAVFPHRSLADELKGMAKAAIDPRYLIMAIPMFCCEMALGLLSSVNSRAFNLRTRALNNLMFNVIQMFVPPLLTKVLDSRRIASRRKRGLLGIAITGSIACAGAAGLVGWIERNGLDDSRAPRAWDWTDTSIYVPMLFIYWCFGTTYAGYQMVTEYTLSSTTNDPDQLSKVAGLFKFYSSMGMFLSFILGGQGVVFVGQTSLQLVLYFLGSLAVVYILWRKVLETNYFTEKNVIVPHDVEERMRAEGKVDEVVLREEEEKESRVRGEVAAVQRKGSPEEDGVAVAEVQGGK